jgi:hypothetical protein
MTIHVIMSSYMRFGAHEFAAEGVRRFNRICWRDSGGARQAARAFRLICTYHK